MEMTRDEVHLVLAERLPDLREPCKGVLLPGGSTRWGCGPRCRACSGRGWVPKDWHLEDLLAAARQAEYPEQHLVGAISDTLWQQPHLTDPDEILEAAERGLLEALPK